MATQTDYSNINNYTDSLNNFLAENSENFVNGDRTFNQWTGKFTDSCEYKQRLNLATKPMEYYVNSLNNISGVKEEVISFTPIGNAAQQNIANVFDRPIPSTLQTSSVYTLPYLTSPNLQATNNINTLKGSSSLLSSFFPSSTNCLITLQSSISAEYLHDLKPNPCFGFFTSMPIPSVNLPSPSPIGLTFDIF